MQTFKCDGNNEEWMRVYGATNFQNCLVLLYMNEPQNFNESSKMKKL